MQRHLAGEIISALSKGFKLVAARFMQISQQLAEKHYGVHRGKPFEGVVKYLASQPVLVMVWEAEGIIAMSRKLMGATFGFNAKPGTIRGDLAAPKATTSSTAPTAPKTATLRWPLL